ncbi:glycine-rich domain-containing protein [Sagittula sp.]|uniref:glycine-rich domain-containing protein n=1 Tax=Sagittula sp. TaxID=2038081 RepID=UPI003519185B
MTTPETTLRLIKQPSGTEIPFPANSGTFIDCDLSPIADSAHLARDVNGNLIDLGDSRFRKYALTLSCGGGVQLPGLANLWPGMAFTVELPVVLKEPGMTPSRDAVEGSVRLVGGYVEYRPVMSVMLTQNSLQETEWRGRSSGWSLSFEEIDAEFSDAPALPEEMVEATGGVVTDYVDEEGRKWREHDLTATEALFVAAPGWADVVVASGGGGGGWGASGGAGGGGAGGFLHVRAFLSAGIHSVVIGAGGRAGLDGQDIYRNGVRGSQSAFFGHSPLGGGGGLGITGSGTGYQDGGSGGGQRNPGYYSPGYGQEYLGHDGGAGDAPGDNALLAGGGGGAGGSGGEGNGAAGHAGHAGAGISLNDVFPGRPEGEWVCCGGPGTAKDGYGFLQGSPADGGAAAGQNGGVNTGSGGGGGTSSAAGNGGSGRVIIRYRIA